eukprot:CAMPEP_0172587384 /NCGR_PEP_ID=MMETSP1068-20121228/6447_1 /TAXON_ID=35684 /ORGANISM="Pseudopedinella elastica, Strain CCMP716" /LENGTH=476 /DNA_ID=CAMNT_0013382391 /DNA_START=246 /DNA_END=1672 /DNA_ORIENTATION=+
MASSAGGKESESKSSSSSSSFGSWSFSSMMGFSSTSQPQSEKEKKAAEERKKQAAVAAAIAKAKKQPSRITQLREGYESLVCAVIRPPRSRYSMEDLGPVRLRLDSGVEMKRTDFELANYQGLQLKCSMWSPLASSSSGSSGRGESSGLRPRSAVVYLHGNSSCRVDATRTGVLETVGPLGCTCLVALDLSGSGLSGGEYVTLGWHEQHDVATVLRHLKRQGFEKVSLWGRSMGAVSAMMFAQSPLFEDVRPAQLVLDSPFASFPMLVDDLIKKGAIKVPRIAIKTVLSMVRSSVKKRTGADIYKIEPLKDCPASEMPALFITADRDEMIPTDHGSALNLAWGGPSLQVTFRGGHNTPRPPHIYDAAGTFLRAVLDHPGSTAEAHPVAPAGPSASGRVREQARAREAVVQAFKTIESDLCGGSGGPGGGGSSDLPPGWLSAVDPETGDTYYYDTATHQTTWFRPRKPSSQHMGQPG